MTTKQVHSLSSVMTSVFIFFNCAKVTQRAFTQVNDYRMVLV